MLDYRTQSKSIERLELDWVRLTTPEKTNVMSRFFTAVERPPRPKKKKQWRHPIQSVVSATLQPYVDLEKDGIFLEIQIYPTALIATARFPTLFELSLYFSVLKDSRYRKLPIISAWSI